MTHYLVAIHRPDNYDLIASEDEAMSREIDLLNEEMVAAGVRVFVGGLKPETTAKSIRMQVNGELVSRTALIWPPRNTWVVFGCWEPPI